MDNMTAKNSELRSMTEDELMELEFLGDAQDSVNVDRELRRRERVSQFAETQIDSIDTAMLYAEDVSKVFEAYNHDHLSVRRLA